MHYTGTVWRPPYEAFSLLLQATAGCTHHGCKFCTLYEELPFKFRMSPPAEVEADLQEAAARRGNVRRVFLTGANPFVLSFEKLRELARLIHKYLPGVQSIGCFARVTDVRNKTDSQLLELRAMGYDGITFGMESGDDAALAFMNKGYAAQDVLTQCRRMEAAGIGYNLFYLTGIAGAGRGEAGARATAALVSRLHPRIVNSSMLTVYPSSALYAEIMAGNWREPSEKEKLAELKTLLEELETECAFTTDGASNLVQVRGMLPRDKEKMTAFLAEQIRNLEENYLRGYREWLPHL